MKVLIATKNKDKFNIISNMLISILGNNITLKDLSDYKNYIEKEEEGDNIERAKFKARNFLEQVDEYFDFVLGIDDGIIIDNIEYVTVKNHLYDIVIGNKVKIGTKIYITRAYYLITNDKKEYFCYNKIPYIVRKKLNSFDEVGYPLNAVISTIDNEKVLTERTDKELNDYFLKYSKDDLIKLFDNINKEVKYVRNIDSKC